MGAMSGTRFGTMCASKAPTCGGRRPYIKKISSLVNFQTMDSVDLDPISHCCISLGDSIKESHLGSKCLLGLGTCITVL